MKYRLVEASPADEAWLEGLRRRAYADLFDATWGGWDEARHARHFADSMKRGSIYLIQVGGRRVGMIQLLDHGDAVEVAEVQIDPAHQGRGIGTRVLGDVISDSAARGVAVHLQVGLENRRAIALYRRLGFESTGRSDTHRRMRWEEGG